MNNSDYCIRTFNESINSGSSVKWFDLALFIPSLIFLIFLIIYLIKNYENGYFHNSPVITTFYALLSIACICKVIRAIVVISITNTDSAMDIANKVSWLIMRFFLFAIEISIITFGLFASRLDNRAGIRRVIIYASIISLCYTSVQAILEFNTNDSRFKDGMFQHGNTVFLLVSCTVFTTIYITVIILPKFPFARHLKLPTKKRFYVYCFCLAVLYFVEAIACAFLLSRTPGAYCVIGATTLLYFSLFDLLVFLTFLEPYFRRNRVLHFRFLEEIDSVPWTPGTSDAHHSANSHPENVKPPIPTCPSINRNNDPNNSDDSDNSSHIDQPNPNNLPANANQYYPDNCIVVFDDENPRSPRDKEMITINAGLENPDSNNYQNQFVWLPEGARLDMMTNDLLEGQTRSQSHTISSIGTTFSNDADEVAQVRSSDIESLCNDDLDNLDFTIKKEVNDGCRDIIDGDKVSENIKKNVQLDGTTKDNAGNGDDTNNK